MKIPTNLVLLNNQILNKKIIICGFMEENKSFWFRGIENFLIKKNLLF
jgi:hypothetical protein